MDIPAEIAFKQIDKSDAMEALIRERIARLERSHRHIVSCRVVVENPHRASESAKPPLAIAVEVSVAGGKMVVAKDEQARHDAKGDLTAFVNRAFKQVERQLDDHDSIRRGDVKAHAGEGTLGRVARLFPEQNYGFVEVSGSPDLYFTRNAVVGGDYEDLEIGAAVRVTVATTEGPMGPQASSVRSFGEKM